MRNYLIILLFALIFIKPQFAYAESSYVLPYPSAMPGNIWYKMDLVKEKIYQLLYFGDFSQFSYNLGQSDKYLVEAKTLFEYKQYLLGYQALLKSNKYFKKVEPNLASAKNHGKQVFEKKAILKSAAEKHIEILADLSTRVPKTFLWTPEKDQSTNLNLKQTIINSIRVRTSDL